MTAYVMARPTLIERVANLGCRLNSRPQYLEENLA